MNNEVEIWKDIPGYDGLYMVSNMGNVKGLKRLVNNDKGEYFLKEKLLKSFLSKGDYLNVFLYKKGQRKTFKLHQLIAMAFLNHKPCGHEKIIDHINNNRKDNRLINLQITTNRHNSSKDKKGYSSQYVGVTFHITRKKWVSRIYHNEKRNFLGYFDSEYEAHLAYQNKLKSIENG